MINTVQIRHTNGEVKNYPIAIEVVEKVKTLVAGKTVNDTFGNCNIDLTGIAELKEKDYARAFQKILIDTIEQNSGKHLVTLKISSQQVRLYKYVQQLGFVFHQAHADHALAIKCLSGHTVEQCTYPKYKTASIGVTGVVFNRELTKFVAIQELTGPYRGLKAPTGMVDYEKGEEPIQAVVRELKEETNVHVKGEDAVLVANNWTSCFRGTNPDINYTYAFTTDEGSQELKAQATEIKKVEWKSVDEFLKMQLPVSHDKPLVIKGVVEAALTAIKNGHAWKSQSLHWGSGKAVTLYGASL